MPIEKPNYPPVIEIVDRLRATIAQLEAERAALVTALEEWGNAQTAWLAAEKDDLDLGSEMIEAEVRMIAAETRLYKTYRAALAAVRVDPAQAQVNQE